MQFWDPVVWRVIRRRYKGLWFWSINVTLHKAYLENHSSAPVEAQLTTATVPHQHASLIDQAFAVFFPVFELCCKWPFHKKVSSKPYWSSCGCTGEKVSAALPLWPTRILITGYCCAKNYLSIFLMNIREIEEGGWISRKWENLCCLGERWGAHTLRGNCLIVYHNVMAAL